ncbi:MAG: hypothetical protein JWM59_4604, partial [Verrucomicrobiales bacterium]|nr:hypothetical protein [Verrucomicrobiales bacterium]
MWASGYNGSGELGVEAANKFLPVQVVKLTGQPVSAWQQEQFGAEAGNPAVAGWGADPDHDGVVNLLERAFNMPPLQA